MADIPVLEAAPGQEAPPRKRGRLFILIASVLVLGAAGAGAWFFLAGGRLSATSAAKSATEAKGPALYAALDPPFVVNFEAEQLVRFLQVSIQVMSHDPATIEVVRGNDPVVRNDLLLLLGNQRYEVLSSRTGKEKLRKEALATVRHVVAAAGGKPEGIEAVYFTSFVMQ